MKIEDCKVGMKVKSSINVYFTYIIKKVNKKTVSVSLECIDTFKYRRVDPAILRPVD
jgi:hypothetical protein